MQFSSFQLNSYQTKLILSLVFIIIKSKVLQQLIFVALSLVLPKMDNEDWRSYEDITFGNILYAHLADDQADVENGVTGEDGRLKDASHEIWIPMMKRALFKLMKENQSRLQSGKSVKYADPAANDLIAYNAMKEKKQRLEAEQDASLNLLVKKEIEYKNPAAAKNARQPGPEDIALHKTNLMEAVMVNKLLQYSSTSKSNTIHPTTTANYLEQCRKVIGSTMNGSYDKENLDL